LSERRFIFLHIPKTAGLTLRHSFVLRFGPSRVYSVNAEYDLFEPFLDYVRGETDEFEWHDGDVDNARHLERLAALDEDALKRTRIYMGHFWYGVHQHVPAPSTYLTILRDPVERVLSLYGHRTRRHGLTQSLEQYLSEARDIDIENGQTRRLGSETDSRRGDRVTPKMLHLAKQRLVENFASVGVTERYDESLVALASVLGVRALPYESTNKGEGRPRRTEVEPGLVSLLEEQNQFDAELHRYGHQLLDDQISRLDLERGLAQLHRANRFIRARKRSHAVGKKAGQVATRVRRAATRVTRASP
jgi:hypothetical protein